MKLRKTFSVICQRGGYGLLAMAGKVSSDLQEAIRKRPRLFAELIRELKDAPDPALERVVRETRAKYGTR